MKENKYIYVVVTQTGTRISKTIKYFTNAPFNHSSITDDDGLINYFSFSRFYKHSPLPAGFMRENIFTGVFGMFKKIPCEIYRIKVSNQQYCRFNKLISHFDKHTNSFSYNLLGLVTMPLGIPFQRKNKFVCSQFVAFVLHQTGIAKFNKDISLVTPDDLRKISNSELFYSGDFKKLHDEKVLCSVS